MTVKSRYLGPRNLFTTWRGSLVNILAIPKKCIIAFGTVVNIVATKHKLYNNLSENKTFYTNKHSSQEFSICLIIHKKSFSAQPLQG